MVRRIDRLSGMPVSANSRPVEKKNTGSLRFGGDAHTHEAAGIEAPLPLGYGGLRGKLACWLWLGHLLISSQGSDVAPTIATSSSVGQVRAKGPSFVHCACVRACVCVYIRVWTLCVFALLQYMLAVSGGTSKENIHRDLAQGLCISGNRLQHAGPCPYSLCLSSGNSPRCRPFGRAELSKLLPTAVLVH